MGDIVEIGSAVEIEVTDCRYVPSEIELARMEITRLRAEVERLRAALKPFAKLFAMGEMGIFEANGKHERDLTIAGEGGHLRPKFDLYVALRRARTAYEGGSNG